jgi:DNA-binding NarL/FixJ family response regulator
MYAVLNEPEIAIIKEIIKGKTNNEIALTLGINFHTVKYSISNASKKLQAKNRMDLAMKSVLYRIITKYPQ